MLGFWRREEDILTGFIFLGLICHGIFFVREWLIFGAFLILYRASFTFEKIRKKGFRFHYDAFKLRKLFTPTGIFCFLILLSLCGLLYPIRRLEGWLEALRWLVFLIAYCWGKKLAKRNETVNDILNRFILAGIVSICIAWLPWSEMIWTQAGNPDTGRYAATFGYPNAAAGLIGCLLLLSLKDRKMNYFYCFMLLLSFLSTGSRAAAILLFLLLIPLIIKKTILYRKIRSSNSSFSLWQDSTIINWNYRKLNKLVPFAVMILLLLQVIWHYGEGIHHLLNWNISTIMERFYYYYDSIKLLILAHFLPRAGGWLAFPFVQTFPYFTLYPHSSICHIAINQGLAGAIIIIVWAMKGITSYFLDFWRGSNLTQLCTKTAVLYLGLHSLMDLDMSFGILGFIFWFLAGMNSR